MCGRSSVETLHKLEIMTIGDLANSDPAIITAHLKSHGRLLFEYANGIDESIVETMQADAKGIGNSTTLSKDVTKREDACHVLLELSESVARRLRESGQTAEMISVEIKYNTFKKVSHQKTLQTPTAGSDTIYRTACALLDELWDGTPIRLLGIRSSKLLSETEPVQLSLFDTSVISMEAGSSKPPISAQKEARLEQALDSIRQKYGAGAIVRGSLLHPKSD